MRYPAAMSRWGLAVWTVGALIACLSWAGAARADDGDAPAGPQTHDPQPTVIVVHENGTKTVRVHRSADGRTWVTEETDDDAGERPGEDAPPHRLRLLPAQGPESGRHEGATTARSPLHAVVRWLLERRGEHRSVLEEWFDRPHVPLAGLRDALKADGWTAASLAGWMRDHARRAPAGPGPRFDAGPARCPRCGAPLGDRREGPPPPPPAGALLLWNDGDGWHVRPVAPPPGGAPGAGRDDRPWSRERAPGPSEFGGGGGRAAPAPWAPHRERRAGPRDEDLEGLPEDVRRLLRDVLGTREDARHDERASSDPRAWIDALPPEVRRAILTGRVDDLGRYREILERLVEHAPRVRIRVETVEEPESGAHGRDRKSGPEKDAGPESGGR